MIFCIFILSGIIFCLNQAVEAYPCSYSVCMAVFSTFLDSVPCKPENRGCCYGKRTKEDDDDCQVVERGSVSCQRTCQA